MSQNPTIQGRVNPLTAKLNEIARLNQEHGTRREGGGAPIVPVEQPQQTGGSRVLPPEPVPISAEEEARLQAEFDAQWSGEAPAEQPKYSGVLIPGDGTPRRQSTPIGRVMPSDFVAIDLKNGHVIADNGDTYPIMEIEKKEIQRFAFNVMLRSLQQQVLDIAKGLGLTEEKPAEQPAVEVPAAPRKTRRKKD